MPVYKVTLARSYVVNINAGNAEAAREMSEFYLGYSDDSTPEDRKRFNFSITDVEMTMNEAIEAETEA